MGNCLRRESGMEWAGEDWGSVESKSNMHYSTKDHTDGSSEKLKLLGEIGSTGSSSSSRAHDHHEVKIKISKKELEQLVGRLRGVQGLSVEQLLLSKLMDGDDYYYQYDHLHHRQLEHQRSWRPVLQSIPEVN
ncbi:hypothetical protein PanWU01x14_270290 [Parasponia andersonii]|uniref:Uncharacterized protein n=1 Tax=Parasponia andersonii TaxID=3476 RepID=A0A2P5B536_PARAD|nr:hypothetical protein PanWU01x14_270290 [Parasponia andersonii]